MNVLAVHLPRNVFHGRWEMLAQRGKHNVEDLAGKVLLQYLRKTTHVVPPLINRTVIVAMVNNQRKVSREKDPQKRKPKKNWKVGVIF